MFTGSGNDPNAGPLFILLAVTIYTRLPNHDNQRRVTSYKQRWRLVPHQGARRQSLPIGPVPDTPRTRRLILADTGSRRPSSVWFP